MSIQIKDIAKALSFSTATVSWVLSGQGRKKGISEATIKKIQEYSINVNYKPNLLARSLSLGVTNTIGLIIPFIDDTFYAEIAQAIEEEAANKGYVLMVCSSGGDSKREAHLIQMLKAKQVDGLILASTKKIFPEIKDLKKNAFPFVLIDRYFPELESNIVIVNNTETSYKLIKHLIDNKGSKKILLITSDTDLLVMEKRINGYKKAIEESELKQKEELILEIDRSNYQQDLVNKLDQMLFDHPDIDAFYFTTHYIALETMRYFTNKGIEYNAKYNFVCFHEMAALDVLAPQMSVSRMPVKEMGRTAVNTLIENIEDKTLPSKKIMLNNTLFLK